MIIPQPYGLVRLSIIIHHSERSEQALSFSGVGRGKNKKANRFNEKANRFNEKANRFHKKANRFNKKANRFSEVATRKFFVHIEEFFLHIEKFFVHIEKFLWLFCFFLSQSRFRGVVL